MNNNESQSNGQNETQGGGQMSPIRQQQSEQEVLQIETHDKRFNGFSWPPNCAQISPLISIAFNLIVYFWFLTDYVFSVVPELDRQIDIFSIIFSFTCVVSLYFVFLYGIRATQVDPEDKIIAIQLECRRNGRIFYDEHLYDYYCQICELYVQDGSKHCRTCNKCVEGFDHHCQWLNNCIGRKNYEHFFRLIVSAFLAYLSMLCIQVKCLVQILKERDIMEEQSGLLELVEATQKDREKSEQIKLIILITVIALNFLSILPVTELTRFHIMLRKKNITTFEYLKQQDRRNKKSKVMVKIQRVSNQPSMRSDDPNNQSVMGQAACENQSQDQNSQINPEMPSSIKKQVSLKSLKDDIDNIQHANINRGAEVKIEDQLKQDFETQNRMNVYDGINDKYNAESHEYALSKRPPGDLEQLNIIKQETILDNKHGMSRDSNDLLQINQAALSAHSLQPSPANNSEQIKKNSTRRNTEIVNCGCFRIKDPNKTNKSCNNLTPLNQRQTTQIQSNNKVQKSPITNDQLNMLKNRD